MDVGELKPGCSVFAGRRVFLSRLVLGVCGGLIGDGEAIEEVVFGVGAEPTAVTLHDTGRIVLEAWLALRSQQSFLRSTHPVTEEYTCSSSLYALIGTAGRMDWTGSLGCSIGKQPKGQQGEHD